MGRFACSRAKYYFCGKFELMKFRTEYTPTPSAFKISPDVPTILLGSCFADNMRQQMRGCGWHADNPFGTLFNPLSIARVVRAALGNDFAGEVEKSVFENGEIYASWLFDSKFSNLTPLSLLESALAAQRNFLSVLKKAEVIFVTFGTSYCYFFQENPEYVVANCHKQPQKMFLRRRVAVAEIVDEWTKVIAELREVNPQLKVVFTVSPVRHLRDGFAENTRSKGVLLLAVEELCARHRDCVYFPAYEIMMDDLRDYRFYASDLLHPSSEGVEYIWERLKETFLAPEGLALLKEAQGLQRRRDHRPLITGTPSADRFAADTERLVSTFRSRHPDML